MRLAEPEARTPHAAVMIAELAQALAPRDGACYVDGTFGAGGHARALLDQARCRVFGIDRDPRAVAAGARMARRFEGRLTVLRGLYGDMDGLVREAGVDRVDGVALDLGVSSTQLDDPERGFSFRGRGPLDMRMGEDGRTAAEIVNEFPEAELARIIRTFGEEPAARRIAAAIVKARPIATTDGLAEVVRRAVGRRGAGIDPATRTFQAIRIVVNDELAELDRGLAAAETLLASGGRLAVLSFHSLEDRRVKAFLRRRSGGEPAPSRHAWLVSERREPSFRLLWRGALKPTSAEVAANPRSRSARLRAAERTSAPAWGEAATGPRTASVGGRR